MTWLVAALEALVTVGETLKNQAARRMALDAAKDTFPKSMVFQYLYADDMTGRVGYWSATYRGFVGVGTTKAEAANMALKRFADG